MCTKNGKGLYHFEGFAVNYGGNPTCRCRNNVETGDQIVINGEEYVVKFSHKLHPERCTSCDEGLREARDYAIEERKQRREWAEKNITIINGGSSIIDEY